MPIDEVPAGLRPTGSESESEFTIAQNKMECKGCDESIDFDGLSYKPRDMRLK